jgi:predicted dehydrogenase
MDMLHGVYLAEHLLGAPFRRSSAFLDNTADGDPVEGLALCRFESDRRAALVNVAWGVGNGGIQVVGTNGRLTIRYRDDGTPPWAPFRELVVTSRAGDQLTTRTLDLPVGKELAKLDRDAMAATVADVADAIEQGRPRAATGAQALAILEATLAAYGSAALGQTITLPLPTEHPLHQLGVVGLHQLDVPAGSPVRGRGLFGLSSTTDQPPGN